VAAPGGAPDLELDGTRPVGPLLPEVAAAPFTVTATAPPVLPCYLAVDTSDSMAGEPLDAAGAQLARLWDAVRDDAPRCGCSSPSPGCTSIGPTSPTRSR
jgi:hypothetical protein